jgi:hypothetical protein
LRRKQILNVLYSRRFVNVVFVGFGVRNVWYRAFAAVLSTTASADCVLTARRVRSTVT